MNAQYFDRARAAYRSGDFAAAAQMFNVAKEPGEVCGEADHFRGNSLMKLGMFAEAAEAYAEALADPSYGKYGALLTNQGKAYAAAGNLQAAADSFSRAAQDTSYATPYKAHLGLGNALLALGNVADAGVAFRSAAIDGTNPAPASALASLGDCFVRLGRPGDAVESYLTALDYVGPHDDPRSINAGLGCAYAAANRHADAVDAFGRATADGIYQLNPDQATALATAQDVLAAQVSMAPAPAAAGIAAVDPLDPLGQSGAFMPDPSDTGFFTLTENEMIQQDKKETRTRRRKRHTGLKVFITILVILIVAAAGLGFAYTRGMGIPSQQQAVEGLFAAVTDGDEEAAASYLAPGLSEDARSLIISSIPSDATPEISGLDRGMTHSVATVTVQLSLGGTQTYEISFARTANYIGWAVESVSIDFGESGDASSDAEPETPQEPAADPGSAV